MSALLVSLTPLCLAFLCLCLMIKARKRYREALTALVFLLGMVLGTWGFLATSMQSNKALALLFGDAIYQTLQLIPLNIEADKTQGLCLQIARLLLPLATAQAIMLVLMSRIEQWWLRLRLLPLPMSAGPDTVVLGCSQVGLQLLRFYACAAEHTRGGRWFAGVRRPLSVVVDTDPLRLADATLVPQTWHCEAGFELLREPADSPETLRTARTAEAKRIIVSTGDELQDMDVLSALADLRADLAHAGNDPALFPEVIVAVNSSLVARASQFNRKLAALPMHFLNVPRLEARQLLREYPPHRIHPERFSAGRDNPCHIVVWGEGPFIIELVAHAARALVYDPARALRITVLTRNAQEAARAFFSRFPALDPQADEAHPAYGEQLPVAHVRFAESRPSPVNANAIFEAHAEQPIDVIYVAGESDHHTCAAQAEALKVADTLRGPRPHIVACLADSSPSGTSSHGSSSHGARESQLVWPQDKLSKNEHPLRVAMSIFLRDRWQRGDGGSRYPEDFADDDAKAIWAAYLNSQQAPTQQAPTLEEAWHALSAQERWWNRCSGDHAVLKRALLGLGPDADSDAIRKTLDEQETATWLCQLEHRRYVCERLTDGWLNRPPGDHSPDRPPGGGAVQKFNAYQLNPTIVRYNALTDADRLKDEAIISLLRSLSAVAAPRAQH